MTSSERESKNLVLFRFTIREILLLTLAAGLALGWGIEHADWARRMRSVRRHAMALRDSLENAEQNYYSLREAYENENLAKWSELENDLATVDWELAAQMIP